MISERLSLSIPIPAFIITTEITAPSHADIYTVWEEGFPEYTPESISFMRTYKHRPVIRTRKCDVYAECYLLCSLDPMNGLAVSLDAQLSALISTVHRVCLSSCLFSLVSLDRLLRLFFFQDVGIFGSQLLRIMLLSLHLSGVSLQ